MPLKSCSRGGKKGTKYGNKGRCYTGKNQLTMAKKQARAIRASGYKGK